MGEFRMPALGAGMEHGRVLEWHVQPGDSVRHGELIALVETDKANIEVEVFEDGVIEELLVPEGTKVPVGTVLARLTSVVPAPADADTHASAVAPAAPAPGPARAEAAVEEPDRTATRPRIISPLVRRHAGRLGVELTHIRGTGPGNVITRHDVEAAAISGLVPRARHRGDEAATHVVRASPYARRLAAERGLDPVTLTGTGPDGAVIARDILALVPPGPREPVRAAAATPAAPEVVTPTLGAATDVMRQAIARAMERSNREIPHYHLGETIDVEATLGWLSEANAQRPPATRLLPAVLVLKATALALLDHPDLNGFWIDGSFHEGEGVHLGVAINLRRGGLLAPAIRHADQKSVAELMAALRDLVERTRSGGLRGSELTDPTFTVSNLGDTGVESIHGLITPPQVGFLGVGRITPRPWAVGGTVVVRRTVYLGLAADHRASDGHRGGRFLGAIARHLSRPEAL